YRGVKDVERRLLDSSDAFVVLTEKAREILFPGCENRDGRGRPIEVIPCCIDPRRFARRGERDAIRRELGLEGRRVIVYAGSFGGWYLTDSMIEFFAAAHRQDRSSFAMVLTQSDAGEVKRRLIEAGLAEADFLVRRVAPDDVPRYLEAADIALSFIKPCYSKQASSPTKIAEYLISGLPVVSNAGIGDLDELIEDERVGRIVRAFTPAQYELILREMDRLRAEEGMKLRCRQVALAKFDLARVGGVRYRRLYERVKTGAEGLGLGAEEVLASPPIPSPQPLAPGPGFLEEEK
ncbi:MAG: glycosyltransferase, partial [Blastocatellia bacterium]